MTSRKSKKRPSASGKSFVDSDSDSDDIEAFTQKFMTQVKKLSPEQVMKLNNVDNSSDETTDNDSEHEYFNVAGDSLRQNNSGIFRRSRFIEGQSLADNEDSEEDGDDGDEVDHDEQVDDESDEHESDVNTDDEIDGDGVDDDAPKDSDNDDEENTGKDNSSGMSEQFDDDDDDDSVDDVDDDVDGDDDDTRRTQTKHLLSHEKSNDDKINNKKPVEDTFRQLRQELADLPFDELQKLKEKIGIKAYNQAMFGRDTHRPGRKVFKRENKNRPTEMSSKRPVPRFREVIQVKKKIHRDPRFDDLSGEYNERVFRQAYSFLNEVKQRDKKKLLKLYEKERDSERKKQIELLIKRMNQQEKAEHEKHQKQIREVEMRKKELELIKQGKRPYFLKKADKKKLELAEKFRALKKSGKVEKYLAKKRKKTAAKERKRLPNRHFVQT